MKKFAVIGNPIEHSLSPTIHTLFAQEQGEVIDYKKLLSTKNTFQEDIKLFFDNEGIGMNVTIPFKDNAYLISDENDKSSILCKSANTLFKKDNKIKSYNTDGDGLLNDFDKNSIDVENKKILVIGAGGAAKSILTTLCNRKPNSVHILNRTKNKIPIILDNIKTNTTINIYEEGMNFDLIINTTSISMINSEIIFPKNIFMNDSISYDLFYSKQKTKFQLWSEESGAKEAYNGLGMLIEQAALSYEIWNNYKPDTTHIKKSLGF
ncbi:MAG: shikimate dehydrogenase [Gammaproteobacteria bacterium]|nr:shikimate dehydrogenase [Gammaproteobacteria bacterium]|tara:strand:+ start:3938 stop:4732 length:795 start_codon:yes stop_codon:yes gene_type:complete